MKLLSLIFFQLIFILGLVNQLAATDDDYKAERIRFLETELGLSQDQVDELTVRFDEILPEETAADWNKTRIAYEQILLEVLDISQQQQLGETYSFGRECTSEKESKFTARASTNKSDVAVAHNSLSLAPNPTTDYVTVSYEIQKAGNITMELNDDQGQTISIIANGYIDIGNYTKRLDMTALPGSVYFITMLSDTEILTEKVILQK